MPVGAIVVVEKAPKIVEFFKGWNHLTTGLEGEDINDRDVKYGLIEHAERDTVYQAARAGVSLLGATMYCPWAACSSCARAIVLSGIKKVVCHGDAMDQTPERWQKDIGFAQKIFDAAGVQYIRYYGRIGGCQNLFDGRYWNP